MVRKVVAGDIEERAMIWKEGMPEWQPLAAHFKRPPESALAPFRMSAVEAPSSRKPIPRKAPPGFLSHFWSGRLSLPLSFWVVGIVGNMVAVFLFGATLSVLLKLDYDPVLLFSYLCGAWFFACLWGTFQAVGTWRSATRDRAERVAIGKSSIWPVMAQVVVVCGTVGLAAQLVRTGAPQAIEIWQIAFEGDPGIPDYTLRLMRDGTELEINGGIKFGLATEVEKVIRDSPGLRVLHLNSIGGRLGAAEKLAKVIRGRGLVTYTSSECSSACTIAFAAGRERYLKVGAKLGYHAGVLAGAPLQAEMRHALIQAGLPPSFADRAVSFSSQQMWYPTVSELEAAKAITGIADSRKFAMSGLGERVDAAILRSKLREDSFFQVLESSAPDRFRSVVDKFLKAYLAGMPEGIIQDTLRESEFGPLVRLRLQQADDEIALKYAALVADQYEHIGQTDSKSCYEYAALGRLANPQKVLSTELRRRELGLTEELLRSRPARVAAATPAQIQAIYSTIRQRLSSTYGQDGVDLLALEAVDVRPDQYARYCRLSAGLYREITRLPIADAGRVMRAIYRD